MRAGARLRGQVRTLGRDELRMGYRKSRVADEGFIVISAIFALAPGNEAQIRADMDTYQRRREEKQPLELPSAGSTFKRPGGVLCRQAHHGRGPGGRKRGCGRGLDQHCGFVVNTGGATAADVCALIEKVQDTVREKFGVELEPEVRRIGEFV